MKIEIFDESRHNGRHKILTIDMAVKRYTKPKLYIPRTNGKPSVAPGKHWYVWFRWTYSDGSRQKFKYSKKINFLKTVQERKAAGEALQKGLTVALDRGWVPGKKKQEETSDSKKINRGNIKTLASAMEFAFEIKKRSGKKQPTLDGYEFHMTKFLEWAKKRRIIDKIKPTLAALEIEGKPGSFHIFTNEDKPKNWSSAKLKSRYDHFGERFRVVKKALGYGREYGLYSWRHTAILDLYYSLQKRKMNEQEILFKLMPITQHKSIAGLRNYLRNLKMIMPADHSDIYTIEF